MVTTFIDNADYLEPKIGVFTNVPETEAMPARLYTHQVLNSKTIYIG